MWWKKSEEINFQLDRYDEQLTIQELEDVHPMQHNRLRLILDECHVRPTIQELEDIHFLQPGQLHLV